MTTRLALLALAAATLAACSGDGTNPFDTPAETDGTTTDGGTDSGQETEAILGGRPLPPGTANPTPSATITRYEARDDNGNGFAERPVYSAETDTFTIDNLAFDGDNTYSRDDQVPALGPAGASGPFAVYENAETVTDPVNGQQIQQLPHKLIFQRSESGKTELVIVRTGGYIGYGYGGWAYQRNGGVTLPTDLQATFSGDYAAVRDFDSRGGLEYVTGDIRLDIDFQDFNGATSQDAIKGEISNRQVFLTDGTDVTQDVIDALNPGMSEIPTILLDIGPNTISANGEFAGSFQSGYIDANGDFVVYETGTYNGILAGDDPSEAVGITVSTGEDRIDGDFRETGGFIATR